MPPGSREPTSACCALALGFLGPLAYAKCLFILNIFLFYGIEFLLVVGAMLERVTFLWDLCVNMFVWLCCRSGEFVYVGVFVVCRLVSDLPFCVLGFVNMWCGNLGESCIGAF